MAYLTGEHVGLLFFTEVAQVLEMYQDASSEGERENGIICLLLDQADYALEALDLSEDINEGHAEAVILDFVFPCEVSVFDILRLKDIEESASSGAETKDFADWLGQLVATLRDRGGEINTEQEWASFALLEGRVVLGKLLHPGQEELETETDEL